VGVAILSEPQAAVAQKLVTSPIEASSPREDVRKKIFSVNLNNRACEVLAKDPSAESLTADPELKRVVKGIIESVSKGNEKTLRDFFNPRAKVKASHVLASLASLKRITGANATVANFRIFALNSPDGAADAIECQDTSVKVHPLYGYPLSVGVWLQATGDSEVVRIFASLVPDQKTWTIGAWHVQQWTHSGKEFSQWFELAQSEAKIAHKGSAYIASDIASKLLDGGGFIVFPVKEDVDAFRDKQMSAQQWFDLIKSTFPNDKLIYANSLFVPQGAAVLVRFEIKAEMSLNLIKEHCAQRLRDAMKQEWSSAIVGIRCSYNTPREDSKKEGVTGGILVTKDSLVQP
jgi:hypothetical protein